MEGQELYTAQDLLKGYGFEGRKVSNTLADWKVRISGLLEFPVSQDNVHIVSVQTGTNSNKGTYCTEPRGCNPSLRYNDEAGNSSFR